MPKSAPPKKRKVNLKDALFHFACSCGAILILILTGVNINKVLSTPEVLGVQIDNTPLINEKIYWEKIVKENPTYRDGYLQLAIIANTLGDKKTALINLNKAKSIDPNSEKILEVEKLLSIQD